MSFQKIGTRLYGKLARKDNMSRNALNLVGQTFGKLTVLSRVDKSGRSQWLCLCECGVKKEVTANHLKTGSIKSCGCGQKKYSYPEIGTIKNSLRVIEILPPGGKSRKIKCRCICGNILVVERSKFYSKIKSCGLCLAFLCVGVTFGRLQAIGLSRIPNKELRCICDCGTEVFVGSQTLRSGGTTSCGCYQREQVTGVNNPNWKGGTKALGQKIRVSRKYTKWKKEVFSRDNNCCQICQQTDDLHAHHIVHLAQIILDFNIRNMEDASSCPFLWDSTNGSTLCENCHINVHRETLVREMANGLV